MSRQRDPWFEPEHDRDSEAWWAAGAVVLLVTALCVAGLGNPAAGLFFGLAGGVAWWRACQ